MVTLGAELRRWRIVAGMTQTELAKALGLTAHSNISDYERGRRLPPLDIIIASETALKVPSEALLLAHEKARR